MFKMVFGVLQSLHPPCTIFFPGSRDLISPSASGGLKLIGINRNRTGKINHERPKYYSPEDALANFQGEARP